MPTIKDVAKHAGVSVSTVSYALSGKRPISQNVRDRVEKAVMELGFTRSVLAHNLRKGLSHTIGMVHPPRDIMLEGSSIDFIISASETIKRNYTLSLFPHPQSAENLLDAFRQRAIDGLILMHVARHDDRVEALRGTDYPFALIGRPEDTQGLNLVDFDFEEAAYLAIQHLVELGHHTIGYLDLPTHERTEDLGYAFYIQQGFERAKKEFDIKLIRQTSGRSNRDSYVATKELLKRKKSLTAIIVLLGATYLGVSRALFDLNKRIPEDYSIICLGSTSVAQWVTPTISTLDNQLIDLGRIAAELLLQHIAGNHEAKQIILPAKLVKRESTAPPGKK
jgi:DNA-binding LacI/PurR family transcriptional regulator